MDGCTGGWVEGTDACWVKVYCGILLNAAALELFRCGYYGMGCSVCVCVCDRSLMQQTHTGRQTGESGDAD